MSLCVLRKHQCWLSFRHAAFEIRFCGDKQILRFFWCVLRKKHSDLCITIGKQRALTLKLRRWVILWESFTLLIASPPVECFNFVDGIVACQLPILTAFLSSSSTLMCALASKNQLATEIFLVERSEYWARIFPRGGDDRKNLSERKMLETIQQLSFT